jgi:hypothetical protein
MVQCIVYGHDRRCSKSKDPHAIVSSSFRDVVFFGKSGVTATERTRGRMVASNSAAMLGRNKCNGDSVQLGLLCNLSGVDI